MNVFNNKMLKVLTDQAIQNERFNSKLNRIIKEGFIEKDNCYYLKKLLRNQDHIDFDSFIDSTAKECFVNSINIDDYIDNHELLFSQSMYFINKLISEWNQIKNRPGLEIILSIQEDGVNIKFHLYRDNEIWINTLEVNNFEESLMIIRI